MKPLRTSLAASALVLGAISLASVAAARPADTGAAKIGKDEQLTCTIIGGNKIRIKNTSIYYLLKGAKLYVEFKAALPGSPNRMVYGKHVVTMKRQIDHDKTFVLAKRLPHANYSIAECAAHIRENDKKVTIGD